VVRPSRTRALCTNDKRLTGFNAPPPERAVQALPTPRLSKAAPQLCPLSPNAAAPLNVRLLPDDYAVADSGSGTSLRGRSASDVDRSTLVTRGPIMPLSARKRGSEALSREVPPEPLWASCSSANWCCQHLRHNSFSLRRNRRIRSTREGPRSRWTADVWIAIAVVARTAAHTCLFAARQRPTN
jgi:hypothetical protein